MFRLFSSFFGGQPANEPARSKLADGLEKLFMFCVDKDLDIGPAYAKFIRVISDSRGWNLFSQNTITYEDINQGIGVLERAFPPGSPASFKHLYLIIRVAFFFEQ